MKHIVAILFLSSFCAAQSWSGLIPAGSGVDWTQAGIPGGIPTTRTQCGSTLTPSGGSDSAAINAALSSCATAHPLTINSPGDGGYVLLGSGTFQLPSSISVPSNVTLRGNGPRSTILNHAGTGSYIVRMGNTNPTSSSYDTAGGTTQGATSISLAGSVGVTSGRLLMISQPDPSWVDNGCSYCNINFVGTTGQVVEVLTSTAGSGTGTVTFRPPLYINYSSARVYPFNVGVKYAGLEYLQIYSNQTMPTSGPIGVESTSGALYSWIKGVENNFADGAHAQIEYSLGIEFRDNFFHDGFYHGSGQNDDCITVKSFSSGSLIENNILYRLHVSVMYEWGGGGHVFSYNFLEGNYHNDFPGSPWMIFDTGLHGSTPVMVLFEGNRVTKFEPDDIHGGSAYLTYFRNYSTGSRMYTPPNNARGALQHTGSPSTCATTTYTTECWEDSTQSRRAFSIDFVSEFDNLVGNIAGSVHLQASNPAGIAIAPTSGGDGPSCIAVGYRGGSTGMGSTSGTGCTGYSACGSPYTTYLHGNFDCSDASFQWSGSVSRTLPASFYRNSAPSYWGTHAWPPIGPDVSSGATGFNGAGYVSTIPAEDCFNNSTKDGNGYPLFDPSICYASGTPTAATPTFDPVGGTSRPGALIASISCSTGSVVCYNFTGAPATNGVNSCATGILYQSQIYISNTATLYGVCGGPGFTDGPVGSAAYTITPLTSPSGGLFAELERIP